MLLEVGDEVEKTGGDYTFRGVVVALFHKRSGALRCVVENQEGILHIFNPQQLKPHQPQGEKVVWAKS